ncbi:hypothetical protein K438DRAFT_1771430 [Mycena galopus ATCC 62051]|nr:hypothetical protein K438DRAFT_1771430 [Mycena galopus ATCC 62051]
MALLTPRATLLNSSAESRERNVASSETCGSISSALRRDVRAIYDPSRIHKREQSAAKMTREERTHRVLSGWVLRPTIFNLGLRPVSLCDGSTARHNGFRPVRRAALPASKTDGYGTGPPV